MKILTSFSLLIPAFSLQDSPRMLTVTLRSLETDGLVIRNVYAEVPPRVEYSLTEMGHSLMPHIESLVGWALEHMADILERRGVQQEVD